jgi:hypothetical protein
MVIMVNSTFTIQYKGETEDTFDWLYLDYNTLLQQNAAIANGLECELILEGLLQHFDYLSFVVAKLSKLDII